MNVHQTHPKGVRGALWFETERASGFDGVSALFMAICVAALVLAAVLIAGAP